VNNPTRPFKYLKPLLRADFLVLLKNRRALIISIIVPLYVLFITNRQSKSTLGSAAFLVVLAITIGLLASSITGYAVTVARDRERGVFQRLRATPAPTWTIMLSRLLVQVLANLVITVVVLVVGSRLHHLSLSSSEYVWTLLIATLGGAVFLSIGQALAGLIKSAATVTAVGSLLYVALLLTGLLGPSGALGSALQNISKWTPVGTIITIFQSALHQTAWDNHTWLCLLACFGYIVIFAAIGIKWFKWDTND